MTTQLNLMEFALRGSLCQNKINDITANYHKGAENSVKAHRHVDKAGQTKRIYEALRASDGLTCQECEDKLHLPHESCSARLSEMKRDRKVSVIGKRPTRSGSAASVYVVFKDNGR